jgi:hypothetical protein
MKRVIKSLFFLAFVYLFVTCSESEQIIPKLDDEAFKKSEVKTVTVPFKASFMGTYRESNVEECDPSFNCKAGVDYEGNGTHLGKFTGSFDFCACGGPNPEHPMGFAYEGSGTVMIAANGDELWVDFPDGGFVNMTQPEDNQPEYVASWWKDPFVITGGTGRFEGATGGGMTDDYNHYDYPTNSFHNWTGTISLVKGKRN